MGVLQFKRGDVKPALQEGEPFFDTDKRVLHIGEALQIGNQDLAYYGLSETLYNKIGVIVVDTVTKKSKLYYAEPNTADNNIPTQNMSDKVFVIIGGGVVLDGFTRITLSDTVKRAYIHYLPGVSSGDGRFFNIQIQNANAVSRIGAPAFRMGTEYQKLEGGEIEIYGTVYFDETGGDDGAVLGVKYKGMHFSTDENFFYLTVDSEGAKLMARKSENNIFDSLGDSNFQAFANVVSTPDYKGDQIFGVDVELRSFPDFASEDALAVFKPFGIGDNGAKKYYPELNQGCAVQFRAKIIGIDAGWADEYYEL